MLTSFLKADVLEVSTLVGCHLIHAAKIPVVSPCNLLKEEENKDTSSVILQITT